MFSGSICKEERKKRTYSEYNNYARMTDLSKFKCIIFFPDYDI